MCNTTTKVFMKRNVMRYQPEEIYILHLTSLEHILVAENKDILLIKVAFSVEVEKKKKKKLELSENLTIAPLLSFFAG